MCGGWRNRSARPPSRLRHSSMPETTPACREHLSHAPTGSSVSRPPLAGRLEGPEAGGEPASDGDRAAREEADHLAPVELVSWLSRHREIDEAPEQQPMGTLAEELPARAAPRDARLVELAAESPCDTGRAGGSGSGIGDHAASEVAARLGVGEQQPDGRAGLLVFVGCVDEQGEACG